MKKYNWIIILLSIIFLFNMFLPKNSFAATEPNINGRFGIAIDGNTKIVLYQKNSEMIVPMASTTKIMTALVGIKYNNIDNKVVEISSRAAGVRGSTVGYKKGEKIKMRELLYGLMLRSGNDAAIAIAEGTSGSVEEFVKLMNEYALEIGVNNTHFDTPHGLDSSSHYTTAYDLAIITSIAKQNELFNEIVSTKDIDASKYGFTRSFHNINKILWKIPNSNGVKTGYTGLAGKCLVTSVKGEYGDIIFVVLNCPERWEDTEKINKYVKDNYTYEKFYVKGQIMDKDNALICPENVILPIKNGSLVTCEIIKSEKNENIKKGDNYGMLKIYQDDKVIYKCKLISSKTYKKKNFIYRLLDSNKSKKN